MAGFPVAFTLGGVALIFAGIGLMAGNFDAGYLNALPSRLYGTMTNETLMAVPLFIFMGITLEKAKIAEDLLETMSALFGDFRGGLAISVILVGMLLAASTGIVGATVVTMGTLGQIIPPSIVLVLLGDVLSSAYTDAQTSQGAWSIETISVGDLFVGAIVPGLILVSSYLLYVLIVSFLNPESMPSQAESSTAKRINLGVLITVLLPPLFLILAVLGSIIFGLATITEAAGVGAAGAILLAYSKDALDWKSLKSVSEDTAKLTTMVFMILIGASVFSLVFRGYEGDELVQSYLTAVPGGTFGIVLVVMIAMFILGFVLDFIEITFVVVPIVAPIILALGVDPIWLGIMIAINLQTSFLTPPFGFALFYLRGVAPDSISTKSIYIGALPFVLIQLIVLILLAYFPAIVTWLPSNLY